MLPEITLLSLKLRSYSLCAAVAALVCAATVWAPLRRCGYSRRAAILSLLGMAAAFLVGARLWNVAIYPEAYGPQRPWYTLRMVGLSLYGGIAGAAAALLVSLRLVGAKPLAVLDAFVLPFALAFAIARVGCFLNGCCAGIKTSLPWGVVFPSDAECLPRSLFSFPAPAAHPTQLYELVLALAGLPFCRRWAKKKHPAPGGLFFCYAAWFCVLRLLILPLRSLPYAGWVTHGLYPALYLSCIILSLWGTRRARG